METLKGLDTLIKKHTLRALSQRSDFFPIGSLTLATCIVVICEQAVTPLAILGSQDLLCVYDLHSLNTS